jgi:hypothetical protein
MKSIKLKFVNREVKIEAQGFHGSSCTAATEFLKNTLGEVTDFQEKQEYFEQDMELGGINTDLCG